MSALARGRPPDVGRRPPGRRAADTTYDETTADQANASSPIVKAAHDAEQEAAAALEFGDRWRAVVLLADAWQPALTRSYHLGYEDGYRAGLADGRAEENDAWQKIMGVYREAVRDTGGHRRPTFAELKRLRGEL